MKEVVFSLNRDYEYCEELKNALRKADIIVSENSPYTDDAYVITDNDKGILLGLGYLYVENEENKEYPHSDAQCVILGFDEIDVEFVERMYRRFHYIPWTIAETDRLIIRESTTSDIAAFYEIYADEDIGRFCKPLSSEYADEVAFIKAYIDNMYGLYGYGTWSIVDKESEKVIGRAGLEHRDGYDELELGYLITKEYRNKGYALESCRQIIRVAKEYYGCSRLNCFIAKDNVKSIAFAAKLGFEKLESVTIDDSEVWRFYICL